VEVKSTLLNTREKVILVINWQRTWMNYVLVFCGWKIEILSDKLGLSAKISRQSVDSMTWFLLSAYSKIQEEREKLKKKLSSKKKPGLEDLENSWPFPIAKKEKKRKCVLERTSRV